MFCFLPPSISVFAPLRGSRDVNTLVSIFVLFCVNFLKVHCVHSTSACKNLENFTKKN